MKRGDFGALSTYAPDAAANALCRLFTLVTKHCCDTSFLRGLMGVGAGSSEEAVVLRMILYGMEQGFHGVTVKAVDF